MKKIAQLREIEQKDTVEGLHLAVFCNLFVNNYRTSKRGQLFAANSFLQLSLFLASRTFSGFM